MTNHKRRVIALEAGSAPAVRPYLVVRWEEHPAGNEAEQAKGYKVQPLMPDGKNPQRAVIEEPFYLATWEDVLEFEKRPDVELTIIEFEYAGNDEQGVITE